MDKKTFGNLMKETLKAREMKASDVARKAGINYATFISWTNGLNVMSKEAFEKVDNIVWFDDNVKAAHEELLADAKKNSIAGRAARRLQQDLDDGNPVTRLAREIIAARSAKGLHQTQVSTTLGLGRQACFKWENASVIPPRKIWPELVKLLDLSEEVQELYEQVAKPLKSSAKNEIESKPATVAPAAAQTPKVYDGSWIIEQRKRYKLSQDDVGRALGLAGGGMVSLWETGQKVPRMDQEQAMWEFFRKISQGWNLNAVIPATQESPKLGRPKKDAPEKKDVLGILEGIASLVQQLGGTFDEMVAAVKGELPKPEKDPREINEEDLTLEDILIREVRYPYRTLGELRSGAAIKSFGTNLRERRERQHWTLEECAEALGISAEELRLVETSNTWPGADTLNHTLDLFDTTIEDLCPVSEVVESFKEILCELVAAVKPWMSAADIARICNVDAGRFNNWLGGLTVPSPDEVRKISAATTLSFEALCCAVVWPKQAVWENVWQSHWSSTKRPLWE